MSQHNALFLEICENNSDHRAIESSYPKEKVIATHNCVLCPLN